MSLLSYGSFWITSMSVFIWSSKSDDRCDGDDYMATWLYTKKWKPPETTICKLGLTQVSFLHMAQQGDLTD